MVPQRVIARDLAKAFNRQQGVIAVGDEEDVARLSQVRVAKERIDPDVNENPAQLVVQRHHIIRTDVLVSGVAIERQAVSAAIPDSDAAHRISPPGVLQTPSPDVDVVQITAVCPVRSAEHNVAARRIANIGSAQPTQGEAVLCKAAGGKQAVFRPAPVIAGQSVSAERRVHHEVPERVERPSPCRIGAG